MTFRPITDFRFTPRDPRFEFRCFPCCLGDHQDCVTQIVVSVPSAVAGKYPCICRCKK